MHSVSPEIDRQAKPHSSPFYNNLVPAYQALWPAVAKRRILAAVPSLNIPSAQKYSRLVWEPACRWKAILVTLR